MPEACVIEIARAKINLALHVLGRRADGYHDLDSLVAFTTLGDRLIFEPADRIALAVVGPFASQTPQGSDNIVLRAAAYLAGRFPDRIAPARITLEKNLPVASGLGGGSADAAAALRGLARLSGIDLPIGDYAGLAHGLGADVPVCLTSLPSRIRGIGEIVEPLGEYAGHPVLLVNPASPLSTASVFAVLALRPGEAAFTGIADVSDMAATRNDLTAAACKLNPVIAEVLSEIAGTAGVRHVRMSGSGSTCFGLYGGAREAERAARLIAGRHPQWWSIATTLS